jgi:uncharacterized protein (TIGR03067 family)
MKVFLVMALAAGVLAVPNKPPKKKDPVKDELKKLEGTYTLVAYELRGRKYPDNILRQINGKLEIKGNAFTLEFRGRSTTRTIKVDAAKKPKAMDMTLPTAARNRTYPGIYSLEGDTLKICYAPLGGNRPQEFATNINNREIMWTFKKAKP